MQLFAIFAMVHLARHLALLFFVCIRCCLASGDASVTYSRGDRNAYLAARGIYDESEASIDPSRVRLLRKQITQSNTEQYTYDDPNECTTYLAESSIPNSGLGLYTTIPYQKDEQIGHSEIGILFQDPDFHNPPELGRHNLLPNYVWSATPLTFGEHEVGHGESVCTGVGMMTNCHFGLVNVDHKQDWKNNPWQDGTDTLAVEGSKHSTLSDVGRGSYTWHGTVRFGSVAEIQAGEEFFINYGPQWYELAEKEFGGRVPSADHYKQADDALKNFMKRIVKSSGMKWDQIPERERKQSYEQMLKKSKARDERLRAALPGSVNDVPTAVKMGTARFSVKNSIRSLEWLKENGACLDNIVGGTSTIPQAGMGAFVIRSIKKGEIISTTPLVTLDREALKLQNEVKRKDGTVRFRHVGHQLILNYCYGHRDSSLVFFPTAPSVSFINHGSKEDANAEIRWSSFPYHKSEWLNSTLANMKMRGKTGLLFDIVATKDIVRGEEILLYYGETWEEKWDQHITKWESSSKNFTEMLRVNTAVDFNQMGRNDIYKTLDELATDPYPDHIMTRCGFALPGDMENFDEYQAKDPQYVPCDILEAVPIENTDRYIYRAKVEHTARHSKEVTFYSVKYDSNQAFLRHTDKPYTRDYYRKGAFRQSIGLGDGIIPSQWIDLRNDNKP